MKKTVSYLLLVLLTASTITHSTPHDSHITHHDAQVTTSATIADIDDFLEDIELDIFFDIPETNTYVDIAKELMMSLVIVGLEYLDRIKETVSGWCCTKGQLDHEDEVRE